MKRTTFYFTLFLVAMLGHTSITLADTQDAKISSKEAIAIAKTVLIENFEEVPNTLDQCKVETWFDACLPSSDDLAWKIVWTNESLDLVAYEVILTAQGETVSYTPPYSRAYLAGEDELTDVQYAQPSENDISEAQAIEEAKSCLREIGSYADIIDTSTAEASFFYGERYNNGFEPVWLIVFSFDGVQAQKVLLAYDGTYLDMAPMDKKLTRTSRWGEGIDHKFDFRFFAMTYQEKAAFSEKWVPIVESYIEKYPYFPNRNVRMYYRATRQIFGLPTSDAITQEEATEIAFQTVVSMGADEATLSKRKIGYSYDVTDPENPMWVLVVYRAVLDENDPHGYDDIYTCVFEVKIDAMNGEVLKTILYEGEGSFDGYYS